MYRLDDTIVAISSPSAAVGRIGRSIIRISGSTAFNGFQPQLPNPIRRGIYPLAIQLPCDITIDCTAYAFSAPASYTGQDLLELHLTAAQPVVAAVYELLLRSGLRQAQPGEFTHRAYLNGKLDLAQAEAVMHIVSASNAGQLAAAERLLVGGLAAQITGLRSELLELLSLIEAGLDFSEETIEFISTPQAIDRITIHSTKLQALLDGAVRSEELMELPSVGLAGLPNAGKSSLMNALTHRQRSIVSDVQGTTRDVLTETLELDCGRCVLFDCAGLKPDSSDPMDQLASQAAADALTAATVILFCVDLACESLEQARAIFCRLAEKPVIGIAAKSDLFTAEQIQSRLNLLKNMFGIEFVPTSTINSVGLETLKQELKSTILSVQAGQNEADAGVAINQRHRQKLLSAIKHLSDAADELKQGHPEIAAMSLRCARQDLGGLEHEPVDERILDVIFSKFCIGK